MNSWSNWILTGTAIAVLAACGGGGSGTSATQATATPQAAAAKTGQFIDAPAKGLHYAASPSGLSGTTDASGMFSYQAGDSVTFSLSAGAATPVTVGTWQPVAPSATSNAIVFVGSLPNGLQVAQVLQTLNHGSASAMDVSGLTLQAQDVTALNAFINSGGTALPTGVASDVALLGAVQSRATGATTYVVPGGSSLTATQAALSTSLNSLTPSTGVALNTLLPGQVVFHEGTNVNTTFGTRADYGITGFNSGGTVASISANSGNSIQTGASWTASGSTLTISGGGVTDTINVSYVDSVQGLWKSSSTDGTTGAGTYAFLQTSFAPSSIAGKTLSLSGSLGNCGGAAFQLVISSTGTTFLSNCQGGTVGSKGSGTIAAVSGMPGILAFSDANGGVHYVGLLVGGTITNGSVAVVDATINPTSSSNGIFGVTAQ